MIVFKHKGNFNNFETLAKRVVNRDYLSILDKYGREGVAALAAATPVDTGKTANSWNYDVRRFSGGATITWTNSNIVDGVPIAIILQYGHGTQYGTYVEGRDYINPAMQSVFDDLASEVWKEVIRL